MLVRLWFHLCILRTSVCVCVCVCARSVDITGSVPGQAQSREHVKVRVSGDKRDTLAHDLGGFVIFIILIVVVVVLSILFNTQTRLIYGQ